MCSCSHLGMNFLGDGIKIPLSLVANVGNKEGIEVRGGKNKMR